MKRIMLFSALPVSFEISAANLFVVPSGVPDRINVAVDKCYTRSI